MSTRDERLHCYTFQAGQCWRHQQLEASWHSGNLAIHSSPLQTENCLKLFSETSYLSESMHSRINSPCFTSYTTHLISCPVHVFTSMFRSQSRIDVSLRQLGHRVTGFGNTAVQLDLSHFATVHSQPSNMVVLSHKCFVFSK